jgi:hypothetical protein
LIVSQQNSFGFYLPKSKDDIFSFHSCVSG